MNDVRNAGSIDLNVGGIVELGFWILLGCVELLLILIGRGHIASSPTKLNESESGTTLSGHDEFSRFKVAQ
jgi:hypothetical protein